MGDVQSLKLSYDQFGLTHKDQLHSSFFVLKRSAANHAITNISKGVKSVLGYDQKDFSDNPSLWLNILHPEDKPVVMANLFRFKGEGRLVLTYRIMANHGKYRWIRDDLVLSKSGGASELIGCCIDVTELKIEEKKFRRVRAHYSYAQKIARLGSWHYDMYTRRLQCSDEVFNICHLKSSATPTFVQFYKQIHPDDRAKVKNTFKEIYRDKTDYEVEYRIILADGSTRYLLLRTGVEKNFLDIITEITGTLLDITDQKLSELQLLEQKSELAYMAYHDDLTGLPNRILFEEILCRAIDKAAAQKQQLGVMLIDIDKFKKINDTYGHHVGDAFIQEFGSRLQSSLRRHDTVSRLAGDEFAIVIPSPTNLDDLSLVAQKILAGFKAPFSAAHKQYLTPSIGISIYPNDATDADGLLRQADVAMYAAKKERNSYKFYLPEMNATVEDLMSLENDLRQAIAKEELLLYYQPQIDMETGQLIGLEAILRWQHPTRGMLKAEDFVSLAEESGMIASIGFWALHQACSQLSKIKLKRGAHFRMCVNISMQQFKQLDFVHRVESLLQETGVDASLIELEITENIAMEDTEETINQLLCLRNLGFRIAIDDFGTGYSSLNCLKHLPINTLKIAKEFVSDILTDQYDFVITEAILSLARTLNIDVIAEGVEKEEQKLLLNRLGCRLGQGYLFNPPMTFDKVINAYKNSDHSPWQFE